ncbi:hypothetical protein [Halomarina litorea]|uniref:hypothetical protein n=1 Tax=Halomarina litorea TaxID=2961595 RepID=UPI0020C34282|nr:hypothetical protein [Halomarina sp. BCD28]
MPSEADVTAESVPWGRRYLREHVVHVAVIAFLAAYPCCTGGSSTGRWPPSWGRSS